MTNKPTYSVFVRFRKTQRLTLKRFMLLDVAIRFASEVRGERFHNHNDVFIVDDASGESISELYFTTDRGPETVPEAPPSEMPSSQPDGKSGLEALPSSHGGRRQLRHMQTTVHGGMRLISTVNQSLAQLDRLMGFLVIAKLPGGRAEQLMSDTRSAIEQAQKVQEGLSHFTSKFPSHGGDEMDEPSEAPLEEDTKMLSSTRTGSRKR